MTIYQLFALLLLLATPFMAMLLIKLLYLHIFGIRWTDLALLFFAGELVLVSKHFLVHSLLPHYLLILSLLAIGLAIFLARQSTPFSRDNFFKLFWRLGFYVTLLSYLILLVTIFIQA